VCAGPEEEQQSEEEVARARLTNLFYAMDSDLNGMLDVEEFRAAMRAAKRELPGDVVAKVLEAMDVHGRLTLDQFIAIAEVCAGRLNTSQQFNPGSFEHELQSGY